MGNHHSSHAGERRHKEFPGSSPVPAKIEGHPINIDKPKVPVLKSQASEEDHEPKVLLSIPIKNSLINNDLSSTGNPRLMRHQFAQLQ